ncbi:ATP-binding protein [Sulfurifustis variabilis]|uniref:ATP-binding protein n=1 Tax=Sulfurifustis variabilis TaxID=1675686 RepID=A0A1C7AEX0_9GAMM|nr:ATP-binding protein [Sulfurifustis variabilis]
MGTKMVDVMLHIDENITHNDREELRDRVLAREGVMAAAYHDDKPHLLVVEYDPDVVSARAILEIVKGIGVHAELIGL